MSSVGTVTFTTKNGWVKSGVPVAYDNGWYVSGQTIVDLVELEGGRTAYSPNWEFGRGPLAYLFDGELGVIEDCEPDWGDQKYGTLCLSCRLLLWQAMRIGRLDFVVGFR